MQLSCIILSVGVMWIVLHDGKDIETSACKYPIHTRTGEADPRSYNNKNKNANPMVLFTLDRWYSVVRQLKLGKNLDFWDGLPMMMISHQVNLTRILSNEQGKVLQLCAHLLIKVTCRVFNNWNPGIISQTRIFFFRYLQTRDYYINCIRINEDKIHPIIKTLVRSYQVAIPKVVSTIYRVLMEARKCSPLYVKNKWEQELSEGIPVEVWNEMWAAHHLTIKSLKWREFSWKN